MFKVYIQHISKKGRTPKLILFDTVNNLDRAKMLILKAKQETTAENTRVFLGVPCKKCKEIFEQKELLGGFCNGCICDDCDFAGKE